MNKGELFHEAQAIAIANASSELCSVVYDLMTESMQQGVDLPPEFRVWMSRMTAQRSRVLLEKLAWRAYRAGVDSNIEREENDRPTKPPPAFR